MKKERRIFIRNTGLATLGFLAFPSCTSGTKSSGDAAEDVVSDPDIGLQLYTLRNQLGEDLDATLKQAADVGYNYVELFSYSEGEYFGMPAADFYKKLSGYNLKPISSHHLTGRMGNTSQGTILNGWEKAVEDAVNAGQEYMVCAWLFPDERKSLDSYKELVDILNKAGQTCKDAGIQFCYHNHDFEFIELEGEIPMYHLLDNTDSDLVKMELDLYWITKSGYNPVEFFNKYPGRTPLWHVKDMANTEEKEFAEVGVGTIDFKRIFENAEKSGMKRFFVEQDVSDNPIDSIKTSYKNLTTDILV